MREKMKIDILVILKKWCQGLVELLMAFPIILAIGILLVPTSRMWIWIGSLSFSYLLGLLTAKYIIRKKGFIQNSVNFLIAAIISYLSVGINISIMFCLILGIYVFRRGMNLAEKDWEKLLPVNVLLFGIIVYFLAYFFYKSNTAMSSYMPAIYWSGVLYLFVTLLIKNTSQISQANLSASEKRSFSSSVLHRNRLIISVTFALILIISGFSQIKDALSNMLKAFAKWLFLLVGSRTEQEQVLYGPPAIDLQGLLGLGVNAEQTKTSLIIEKIAYGVAILIIALLLYFLFRVVFKKIYHLVLKLVNLIMNYLLRNTSNISETDDNDYEDEKESLLKSLSGSYANKFKNWLKDVMEREPKWKDLKDNKERIRYIYRIILFKSVMAGYPYKSYMTPKETSADLSKWNKGKGYDLKESANLYNKVRYSDLEISDEDVERVSNVDFIQSK
jgi:hypothetical protein